MSQTLYCRFVQSVIGIVVAVLGIAAGASAQSSTPVITVISSSGPAPFTVHAHALDSVISIGDKLSAYYEWDFGDSTGAHNTLTGWNVAHVYDGAGTYTLKLTITTEDGVKRTATKSITVGADTRTTIYIAPNGNDANAGTSQSAPIRTVDRAYQLLSENKKFLFQRGGTYNVSGSFHVPYNNVMIGAYGSGNLPVLKWTGPGSTYSAIISMNDATTNLQVQDVAFDYGGTVTSSIVRGVSPDGINCTVRRCRFDRVSYALNGEHDPRGLLVQDCTSGTIGAYFCWAEGSDYAFLGNTIGTSTDEHGIRLGGCDRVLIARNDITNTVKLTIWAMLGSHCYVANNTIREGRAGVGPNSAVGSPSDRFKWSVWEANLFLGERMIADPGAEQVMIRNNIFKDDGGTAISIQGYLSTMNRRPVDVRVFNNTAINNSSVGRFIQSATGAQDIWVANNLFVCPNMVTGGNQTANMFVSASSLADYKKVARNVWSIPAATPWVNNARHYLWPTWADAAGYKTESQWEALTMVENDGYENVVLNAQYIAPASSLTATFARRIPGVHVDYWGKWRPTGDVWSAGAGETNPSSGGGQEPPPPPPPPSGSLVFNMEDGSGWTVSSTNLQDGAWERGIPAGLGDRGDPISDFDQSGSCWLTGNRPGNSDVDGGPTVLMSPSLNLSGLTNPKMSVAVWFTNAASADGDSLSIEISNNGGQSWTSMGTVTHAEQWRNLEFQVANYVTPTSTVVVRFTVADQPSNSVTEAAIDALVFCGPCDATPPNADVNGDGDVGIADFQIVLGSWGNCPPAPAACPADINRDGSVNVLDLSIVISQW